MEKPSVVRVIVAKSNTSITKVRVGGKAVFLEQVEVEI
jgi:predicted PhzF superfamily epimerase YddE/YHI9